MLKANLNAYRFGEIGARHTLTVETDATRGDCTLVLTERLP